MRLWQFFLRNLKETYRDPLALGFLLAFPLLFMLIFGAALGGSNIPSYDIAVVDDDNSLISISFIAEALTSVPTLNVTRASSADSALASLEQNDIHAFVAIPPGFGEGVTAIRAGAPAHITLDLTCGNSETDVPGEIAKTLNSALSEFAGIQAPITINTITAATAKEITQIDFLAPGIIVFGLLIMIPTSARIMTRDKESGYLTRLLATPTRPWEFILGYGLCLLLIAVIQVVFFLLLGWLFGMDITGNLALAFLIFALAAISSIGLGMATAALVKSESRAEPLTWLFAMPLAVLSGVWFSLTLMPRYVQTIANLFPYAHAVEAARAVILRGADLAATGSDLIFLAAWAIGSVLLGIFLFGRTMRVSA